MINLPGSFLRRTRNDIIIIMKNIKENWDEMAQDYDEFTSPAGTYSNAIEWAHIKRILPTLRGRRVLDIGCGSGRFSYYFKEYCPSEIVGLDISDEMLALARSKAESDARIRFENGSTEDLSQFSDGYFDFVFSSTTMHYVKDLKKAFSEAFRVLSPGGSCILSLIHPLYSATYPLPGCSDWELRYQDRRMREYLQPWTRFNDKHEKPLCRSYHYTLADYMNTLIESGFTIRGVHEPQPPDEWRLGNPRRYEDVMNEPIYIVVDMVRSSDLKGYKNPA